MTAPGPEAGDDRLDAAMAEYLELLEAGTRLDRDEFLAGRPDIAARLAPELDGLDALHGAGRQVGTDAAATAPAVPLDRPARVGGFEVVGLVGRGGMGVVYEAVETGLGRRVALKVLPAAAALDPRAKRRFLHEARVAALVQHPHVVPVLSVGEADGVPYYAMPLIDGRSLDAVLRTLCRRDGVAVADEPDDASSRAGLLATGLTGGFEPAAAAPPTPAAPAGAVRTNPRYLAEAVRLAREAADGLAAAHAAGVVHRDVKPGNLLLDVRGKVWVTDFGLATVTAADAASSGAGRAGTLRYMSPEQAAGRAGEVDERADVYALGLTLYELLTLRPAFAAAADADLLRQIAAADPPPVRALNPAVSIDLETVVQKATARLPADRYPTAAALAADLDRVRGGLPVAARRLTRSQRAVRWAVRHRRRLTLLTAAVTAGVLVGLGASGYWLFAAYRQAAGDRARLAAREADLLAFVERTSRLELLAKELPGAQPEQRELVLALADTLDRAAAEPDAAVWVRRQAMRAHLRLVDVEGRRGDGVGVRRAAEAAVAHGDRLLADGTADRADRIAHARGCFLLAVNLRIDNTVDWGEHLHRAERLFTALDAERPDDPAVLNHLGQLYTQLCAERQSQADMPAAVEFARLALTVNTRLAERFPTGHPLSYSRLCVSHLGLAEVLCRAGRAAEAGTEDQFQRAVANDLRYVEEARGKTETRLYTFVARIRYGAYLVGRGRYTAARVELAAGRDIAADLVARFPTDVDYRMGLLSARLELGRLAYLEGDRAAARERFAEAAEGAGRPPADWAADGLCQLPTPGVPHPAGLVAVCEAVAGNNPDRSRSLGMGYLQAGRLAEAEAELRREIPRQVRGSEANLMFRFALAACQARRGEAAEAKATFAAADNEPWRAVAATGRLAVAHREAVEAIAAAEGSRE